MDRCQPITFKLVSGEKVYILLIENEDLLKKGDSECYGYGALKIEGCGYFKSPELALAHAVERIRKISQIQSAEPTLGFSNFFDDQDLKKII